jgi:hypothetical protein
MKKSYIAPQTEAIEVIANGVLMVSSGGFINVNDDPLSGGVGS